MMYKILFFVFTTTFLTSFKFEDHVTESIGKFEFDIWDQNEDYFNAWTGDEIVRYYKDYAADATTLRFRGRIEKPSKRGSRLNVKGRGETLKIFNITVTQYYNDVEVSTILTSLFSSSLLDSLSKSTTISSSPTFSVFNALFSFNPNANPSTSDNSYTSIPLSIIFLFNKL